MTVGQIREMPNSEYVSWVAYFGLLAQEQALGSGQGLAMELKGGDGD